MPAARYWRIARIETFAGGDLELSEVALYEGATRVDGAATVSAVVAPVSGSLADLGDASFSTSARWAGDAVRLPGFTVVWDFGAGVTKDVSSVGVAGPSQDMFAHKFALEYSSDGAAWETLYRTPVASKWQGSAAFFMLDSAGSETGFAGFVLGTDMFLREGDVLSALPAKLDTGSSPLSSVAIDPSGRYVAIGFNIFPRIRVYARSALGLVGLTDTPTRSNLVGALSFSPDSELLAVGGTEYPYVFIYGVSDGAVTQLYAASPALASSPASLAFSPDGTHLAVAQDSSPYLLIYTRSGSVITKLAAPLDSNPSGNALQVTYSPDGTHLAVLHANSPYLTIYSRSGDSYTKLAPVATLPGTDPGGTSSMAYSPDGVHLAVGHYGSPYLTIYKRVGSTYTALPTPSGLASWATNNVAYSPSGDRLLITQITPSIAVFARDGDTYTQVSTPSLTLAAASTKVAWWPTPVTSYGLTSGNFDATPLRTGDQAAPSMLGEDVAGSTQPVTASLPSPLDIYDGGRGRITGTVKEKNTPANTPLKRRVVLLSMPGSRAIRETWSDPVTSVYTFDDVAMDRVYTVVSYDHTGIYRGVVADNLTPELMV